MQAGLVKRIATDVNILETERTHVLNTNGNEY